MSQAIVTALKAPVDRAFGLLAAFIETCPDEVWAATSGGWPVWQQIYHALAAADFFITQPGQTLPPPLAEAEVSELKKAAATTVPRAALGEVCAAAKARVDQFFGRLTDADLPQRNEPLFAKAKFELTLAGTVSMLAAHTLYHLGAGDAALRDRGLPGVF